MDSADGGKEVRANGRGRGVLGPIDRLSEEDQRKHEQAQREAGLRALGAVICSDVQEESFSRQIVEAYIDHLVMVESRRAAARDLLVVVGMITGTDSEVKSVCWWKLEYVHAATVRTLLAEVLPSRHADRCLSVLTGLLRSMWQSGVISEDSYMRAASALAPLGDEMLHEGQIAAWGNEFDSRVDIDMERFSHPGV